MLSQRMSTTTSSLSNQLFAGVTQCSEFLMSFKTNAGGAFTEFWMQTFRFEVRNGYHFTTAANKTMTRIKFIMGFVRS